MISFYWWGRWFGAVPLNAAFAAAPVAGTSPLTVGFVDQSSGTILTWLWTFGDGFTSPLQNPSHTYGIGVWTVSLRVTDALGFDVETKVGYIVVTEATLVCELEAAVEQDIDLECEVT